MADVPAKLVMALRRVTDLPVRDCRVLLRECNGDVGGVFDLMAVRLYFGEHLRAADREKLRVDFIARVNAELVSVGHH